MSVDAGAQETIRYTPSAATATRRRRELESAASGSTHSTYQGSTQLSVTSSATDAHPDAVIAEPRRQACTQQASTDNASAAVITTCSVCVSPPAPTANPIRLGTLSLVTRRLCVLRSGTCSPNAI